MDAEITGEHDYKDKARTILIQKVSAIRNVEIEDVCDRLWVLDKERRKEQCQRCWVQNL